MSQRPLVLGLLVLSAGLAHSVAACAQVPAPVPLSTTGPAPGTAWVIFGADTVHAEVASTADLRSRGLSHRDSVPDGTGMLFTFDRTEERTFWMRNTFVDLDIAFLNEDHEVLEILHMKAETMDLHDSTVPVFMALEVRGGWFADRGIRVGSRSTIVYGPTAGN